MAGKTISNSETKIEALKLQSSAYGVTIPLVFGVQKIAGNLLDYLGFKAVPHTQTQGGKGGGVKVQNTTYTYQADVIMGLCHGPITEVPRIWRGKKLFSGGWAATQIQTATETYTVPGSGAMAYTVANAATWLGMVEVSHESVTEVAAESGSTVLTYRATLSQGIQYTAAAGIITILDASLRGVELRITYQYASGTRPQTAMEKLGLTFKAGTIGQAAWSQLPSGRDVPYSGTAWVAGAAYDLGTGAQVENHVFEVVGPMAYHLGTSVPDVDPAMAIRAVLTQQQGGAGFPAALLDSWATWSDFCVASGLLVSVALDSQQSAAEVLRQAADLTNAGVVWSDGLIKMAPYADASASGNGRTFTPDTTPVYQLDDNCYTPPDDGPPVRCTLKSRADRYNHWRVEFLNRANAYAVEIAEAEDAADIDASGRRSADVFQAHWICDAAVARQVAQIKLQRSLAICTDYAFALPEHYALIEPTDLLTLTDAPLEMTDVPVRVTVIEEQDDGGLQITAEDYPAGTASAARYPSQVGAGYGADYNAAPGNCDTPLVFELPAALSSTRLALGVAVRGSGSAWGGAQVWVSFDGTNYRQIGAVYGGARYGTLSGSITGGASSMGVQGLGAAQLVAGSATDAANLATLCFIGGSNPEFVAYQGATLVSAGAYTLTGLVRAAYGTVAASHSSGDPFVRVDDRIARSEDLDPALIGQTVYIKCCSFNLFGAAVQSLADVSATTYTITGAVAVPANVAGLTAAVTPGGAQVNWTANTDAGYAGTEVRVGSSWAGGTLIFRGDARSFTWPWPVAGTYTLRARHFDRSGRQSAGEATYSVTVDEAVLINVAELRANAATKVHTASASGVSVTGEKGVPTGTFTDLVTYTFTPPYDCEVLITAEGTGSISTPSSGSLGDYAMLSTCLTVNGTRQGALRNYAIDQQIGFSKSASCGFARAQRFTATGGVSYTVVLLAQQYVSITTCTVDAALRIEEIRR